MDTDTFTQEPRIYWQEEVRRGAVNRDPWPVMKRKTAHCTNTYCPRPGRLLRGLEDVLCFECRMAAAEAYLE